MLTIGSVVYLKEGTQKIMILNRGPVIDVQDSLQIFDYSGCLYPVGLVPEEVLYFNDENIDKVIFEGYSDEDESRFQELFSKWREENSQIVRGKVEKLYSSD